MTTIERIQTIKLIEKMQENKRYCKKIGLEDSSIYKSNQRINYLKKEGK